MITAFVTRSSGGTLPVTMRVSEEKLGIPRNISPSPCRWAPPST
jgi:Na+/H+-dicarboxylate symporter